MPPFLLDDLLSELQEKKQSYFVEIGQQKKRKTRLKRIVSKTARKCS